MDHLRPGVDAPVYKKFESARQPAGAAACGLLAALNQNDAQAFTEIYQTLYQPVFYFACRFVHRETAEDITADVFCRLWNMNKNFVHLQQVKIFLQVSVRNACLSFLEHAAVVERHKKLILLSSDSSTDDFFQEDEIKAQYLKRILSAIEALPPRQQKIFKLSFLEGLREREIADRLHLSKSTVHTQRTRAIRRLRLALQLLLLLLGFLIQPFTI